MVNVKMSKSLGNYVGVNEPPDVMFHKIYSLADNLIQNWFELLTNEPLDYIRKLAEEIETGTLNPNEAKRRLALNVVTQYYGKRQRM
jgi:tyrosyl-tRNA synthetase